MRRRLQLLFFAVAAITLFSAGFPFGAEGTGGPEVLLDRYRSLQPKLEKNGFGLPLYLESSDRDGRLHVDVYGVFDHGFTSVLNALSAPANWCDIASLHPNVKACTYDRISGGWQLTFYNGRKFYQSPADSRRSVYSYRSEENKQDYLDITLSAEKGPLGTKEHRMKVEALPLEKARSFVHVSYDYQYGSSLKLAEKIYFATLGRGKVGFTIEGADSSGNPVYVGGPRGAIERNAVRYYLAIRSFMDMIKYPGEKRFAMMVDEWYDLTDHFRKQLFEMEKKDYMACKTAEHKNQEKLQTRIGTGLHQ